MGCELRRQLRSPCRGCWSMVGVVIGDWGGVARECRATYVAVGFRPNPCFGSELSAPFSRGLWRESQLGLLHQMLCFTIVLSDFVHNIVHSAPQLFLPSKCLSLYE